MGIDVMINRWLETAQKQGVLDRLIAKKSLSQTPNIEQILYPRSVQRVGKAVYALVRSGESDMVGIFYEKQLPTAFRGIKKNLADGAAIFCPLDHHNAEALRKALPFTAPTRFTGHGTSFGTGDRLGIATSGHIRALRNYKVWPVLAQQSVREIEATSRTFEEVLDATTWAVFREGFAKPWGADADHLKTERWVKKVLALGYTMVTADVSDSIKKEYVHARLSELRSSFSRIPTEDRKILESNYFEKSIEIDGDIIIHFCSDELIRTILIYWNTLQHAVRLYRAGEELYGEGSFDFEFSIDETLTPTTPLAHVFIARELQRRKIKVFAIAPRFIGSFQKAVDYIGDTGEFASSLEVHAAIAAHFGHRISIHSGSDKFRIYPAIGQITGGEFHLKTSGTSWLEALNVIGEVEPSLFQKIYEHAKENVSTTLKYYRVALRPKALPDGIQITKKGVSGLFENSDVRQLLHISYGEIFKNPELRMNIYKVLRENIQTYWEAIETHISRHLDCLGITKNNGEVNA